MDFLEQRRRSVKQHIKGFDDNKTCIDCHKGIAHSLPTMYEDDPEAALLDKREK
jgi:cytochrome c-type protein NapC